MAMHGFQRGEIRAGHRHELMGDALKTLPNNMKAGIRQEMMHVGDPPRDRVLDGDQGVARGTISNGGQGVFESGASQRFESVVEIQAPNMRMRARLPLI